MSRKSLDQVLWIIEKAIRDEREDLDLSGIEITTVDSGGKFKGEAFPLDLLIDELARIEGLKTLRLSNLKLKNIPPEIRYLSKLTSIDLSNNLLTTLPTDIWQLTNLTELNLSDNRINKLPDDIGKITNLKSLNLKGNRLTTLPAEIGQLEKLQELDLFDNNIAYLPTRISQLVNLESLDLRNNNNLKSLPFEIVKLGKLKIIRLRNTSLPIPLEISRKINEPHTIFNYYFTTLTEKRLPLNEVKLIFVGQGSVGKTSIIQRILFDKLDQDQNKTEGISILQCHVNGGWRLETDHPSLTTFTQSEINPTASIHLNIWDFGGQEIMHATHQFFLTKRSLYLLVLDSRLTQEQNRVEYWLKIIQSFGGESPVLIVGNKIDKHPIDIDRTGLQKKYPNIVGIIETSASTGIGIEELKAAITDQINNMPHVRDLLPETWFTVKTKLEGLGQEQNFITHDNYLELCVENEINDETSQRTLIGFLHDLGVILHFQNDPRLEALGILNPQWVTNGVYKILNSNALFHNKGVLSLKILNEILNLPEYPSSKRLFIVDMMRKFELCYDLEPDKKFLVPDLLPKDEPLLVFAGTPAFEYIYPVLPSSVITRLIVRMNQKIDTGTVWRTGVLLKIGENHALVKADLEDRKIAIAIDGLEHTRRDTLSAIRYQLDEIHASIKGLNPEKSVPIPQAPHAEPLKYDYLLMLERAGQETHLLQDGNRLVKVNVREILSGIESESQRRELGGNVTNIYIGGDVKSSTIVSGDKNVVFTQKIQESIQKAESASIQSELMVTLKLLGEAVDIMNKVLPKEKAEETTEDFGKLVDEATKPRPNQRWYSVSIEGLIKAAENLDRLGEPVINLSRKILSLLTGGVIK